MLKGELTSTSTDRPRRALRSRPAGVVREGDTEISTAAKTVMTGSQFRLEEEDPKVKGVVSQLCVCMGD